MSAVEAAPPPPRPPPPSSLAKDKIQQVGAKSHHPVGFSLDMESAQFEDPQNYDIRRRSLTLGSRPPHSKKQPHVIDSRSFKANGEQLKSLSPAQLASALKPTRPPPPKVCRSLSQPSIVRMKTQGAEDSTDEGKDGGDGGEEGPVLRRRLNSEGSIHSLKRLSSPRRSREISPLPQVPEGSATTSPNRATVAQPLSPSIPSLASPTRAIVTQPLPPLVISHPPPPPRHASPSRTSPRCISPPPTGPPPPAPKRPRAVSSPPRTTPPRTTPPPNESSQLAGMDPSRAPPADKAAHSSPSHLTPPATSTQELTTPTQEDSTTNPSQNSPAPNENPSNEPAPVIPPRPFRPPRPYPPNSSQRKPTTGNRPTSAPVKAGIENSPVRPSRKSPRHAKKLRDRDHMQEEAGQKSPPAAGVTDNQVSPVVAVAGGGENGLPQDVPAATAVNSKTPSPLEMQITNSQGPVVVDQRNEWIPKSEHTSTPAQSHQSKSAAAISGPAVLDVEEVTAAERPAASSSGAGAAAAQGSLQLRLKKQESSEREAEEDKKDKVDPLALSLQSGNMGRKFMNSMKTSFRSLRLKRSPENARTKRVYSDSDSKLYPDPLPHGIIHPIVVQCVAYLNRETVLLEEGLFRVPGDLATIRRLRQDFLKGFEVDLMEILDPHTVSGLLKMHFRELKASLVPRGPPLTYLMTHVKNRDVDAVRDEFEKLDETSVLTLSLVIEVLVKIVSHSDVNHMTSGILATSCGPSIFPYLPPSNANQMTKFLIDNCSIIFKSN